VKRYLLDTSALLTLRDDEAGAARVADLLGRAQAGEVKCLACFITLMAVLYRVWRDEGERAGRLAYEQCRALPIDWVHESTGLLERAAAIKAQHAVSLADAWVAASAELGAAVLVHKDPEFEALPLEQERLPYK
jgi:predicted nucleic acid-binding protein